MLSVLALVTARLGTVSIAAFPIALIAASPVATSGGIANIHAAQASWLRKERQLEEQIASLSAAKASWLREKHQLEEQIASLGAAKESCLAMKRKMEVLIAKVFLHLTPVILKSIHALGR